MFQRIIGRKVYFLRLPKTWQNKKYIKFLKSLGLNWLNFQDYAIKGHAEIMNDNVLSQKQFGNFIDGLNIANALKKMLIEQGCGANDLKVLALIKIQPYFNNFSEIVISLDHIRKSDKDDFVIVGQFPNFLTDILKKEIENKATLLNFGTFNSIFLISKLILNKIKSNVKNLFIKNNVTNSINQKIDLEKFNTIFFPHQGIYYADIFKKDHFYSKKSNSNFYPSNILHLAFADKNLSGNLTNEFYKKNKITEVDFASLGGISLKEMIFDYCKFTTKYYFFSKDKLQSVFFFIRLWLLIKKSLNQLKALPNAKVAIFGYEFLSPRELTIACRIKGIKTIATQERYLQLWGPDSFLVLDHYLVINKKIEKMLSNERLDTIKKTQSIGPIRSDFISEIPIDEEVDTKKIILVLDAHSKKSFYANGRSVFGNWRQNHIFYEDILKLARKNQNIKFIIKGKSYDFIDMAYFKDIKNLIDQTANVELYNNKINSPYELIKNTMLTIAKHTSLVDELLFKRRSVIICDNEGWPSTFSIYGENLIVKNYEELESKFNLWKKNPREFNENITHENCKRFPIPEQKNKAYDLLHKYLEAEFDYYV